MYCVIYSLKYSEVPNNRVGPYKYIRNQKACTYLSWQKILCFMTIFHTISKIFSFSYSFFRYRFLGYWLWRTKCSWSLRQSISLWNMDSRSVVEKKLKILIWICPPSCSPKCPQSHGRWIQDQQLKILNWICPSWKIWQTLLVITYCN